MFIESYIYSLLNATHIYIILYIYVLYCISYA